MVKCEFIGECKNIAKYGIPNKTPKFCKEHNSENMKYLYGVKFCKCGKQPNFGLPDDKRARCCAGCKKDGMINIVNKKCHCGKKQPSFGLKDDERATCCFSCKTKNMINIITKKCNCGKKHPSFGLPDDKQASYCYACKKDGMINIVSKKCHCGKKQPSFGLKDDKRPSCCADCKTKNMIDIINKKCNCGKKRPSFGLPDDKRPTCCSVCKETGMINIVSKKCSCGNKQPSFGLPDDKRPTCCSSCKTKDMINIVAKKCKANEIDIMCPTIGNPKYDGYCTFCFSNIFPSDPKTAKIRKKSKELQVVNHITIKYEGFRHDKPLYVDLNGGCCPSKRRIDLRKLVDNTLLCIEIDEHQHKGYCKIDEENRYNDLFMDFSGKYIFIRYNPDSYKDEKGNERTPRFETKMKVLEKEIEGHTNRIKEGENKELLEIHHLYYDSN